MGAQHLPPLHRRLLRALESPSDDELRELRSADPVDDRDGLLSLAVVHDLHLAPLTSIGSKARWQHHPTVATIKQREESKLLARVEQDDRRTPRSTGGADAHAVVRRLAAKDRVPAIYEWVADEATSDDLLGFLALEGGPDDGFDDLVAVCQVGLEGEPKLEMARNYWDELGCGEAQRVHRALYADLTAALGLPHIARPDLPLAALRRALLTSTFATNRALQPELVGALGMIELQAGPRCRKVVAGLERLGLPEGALPFYDVHATTDPRHGKAWLDNVIGPLSGEPTFAEGMVRGARWRSEVNRRFFDMLRETLVDESEPQAA